MEENNWKSYISERTGTQKYIDNSYKTTKNKLKYAKDSNRLISEEDNQITDRHMNTFLTSLAIRECKALMRHYLTPYRVATIENKIKQKKASISEVVKK